MKKIFFFIFAGVFALTLSSCGGGASSSNISASTPREVVENYAKAWQAGDVTKLADDIIGTIEFMVANDPAQKGREFPQELADQIREDGKKQYDELIANHGKIVSYSIDSVEEIESGKKAQGAVTFTFEDGHVSKDLIFTINDGGAWRVSPM